MSIIRVSKIVLIDTSIISGVYLKKITFMMTKKKYLKNQNTVEQDIKSWRYEIYTELTSIIVQVENSNTLSLFVKGILLICMEFCILIE